MPRGPKPAGARAMSSATSPREVLAALTRDGEMREVRGNDRRPGLIRAREGSQAISRRNQLAHTSDAITSRGSEPYVPAGAIPEDA